MLLPSTFTASRLFFTGATIGPLIDGLHNQALLKYNIVPIDVQFVSSFNQQQQQQSFQSSWVVPPLLGISYIVLGSIIPNVVDHVLQQFPPNGKTTTPRTRIEQQQTNTVQRQRQFVWLTLRAMTAVLSTALIVRWTEVLLTSDTHLLELVNPSAFSAAGTIESYLLLLITVCIVEWAWLDGTMTALLVASLAAVLGPLAELPFLSLGWWEYLDSPALYYPLGEQTTMGIHSLTGPCYFAVTLDAIAIGRWCDFMQTSVDETTTSTFGGGEDPLEAVNGAAYSPEELLVKTDGDSSIIMALGDEPDAAEHVTKG